MEHKDCVMVRVGVQPNGGTVAAEVEMANHICPAKITNKNWNPVSMDGKDAYTRYDDSFSVVQTGRNLAVTRTDDGNENSGWALDLAFVCCWKGGPAYATWEAAQ